MSKPFGKILVGKYNPKNECYAEDGTVLFVKPLTSVPLKDHVRHNFLSVDDRLTKSQYGWVAETEAFDLDDFLQERMGRHSASELERAHLQKMFSVIANLKPETPVAAAYSARGVESKHMEFTVHRVFFYRGE